jgi:murein DD-endopeptidase MepM/ murein hydrolase activator NlpD
MNSKYKSNTGGLIAFLKRNAAYLIMIACVLATALIIALAVSNGSRTEDVVEVPPPVNVEAPPDDDEPVVSDPAVFCAPVAGATIGDIRFSGESFAVVTLDGGRRTQDGLDLLAAAGSDVLAAGDGTVTGVSAYNSFDGAEIVIEHADGLVSIYKYLGADISVSVGDTVTAGQIIGKIGEASGMDYKMGPHLYFCMKQNGAFIDPELYIDV